MFPLGLIAIPLPIASDEKTGSLTEVRATVSPSSGLTIVSALELFVCYKICQNEFINSQAKVGILSFFVLFILANFSLMIINGKRVREFEKGHFVIYQGIPDKADSHWIIQDEYSILDIVPFETEFDDFMEGRKQ